MRAGTYSRCFRDDVKDEEVADELAVVERRRLDHLAAKRCSKAGMRRRPARQREAGTRLAGSIVGERDAILFKGHLNPPAGLVADVELVSAPCSETP